MAKVRGNPDASWLDLAAPSLAKCLPFVVRDTTICEMTVPVLCKLIMWLGRGCRTITAKLAKPAGSVGGWLEADSMGSSSSTSSKRSSSSSCGSSSRGVGTSSSSSSSSAVERSKAGAAPATPLDLLVNPGEVWVMVEAAFASSPYQDFLWLSLARAAEHLFTHYKGKAPGVSGDCEVQPDHMAVIVTQGTTCVASGFSFTRPAMVGSVLSETEPLEGGDLETELHKCLSEVVCCLIDCYVSPMLILQISMELKHICHQEEEWQWQQRQRAGGSQGSSSSRGSRGANPQAVAAAADEAEMPSLDAMVPCLLVRLPEQRLDLQQQQDGEQQQQQQQQQGSGSGGGGKADQGVNKKQLTSASGAARVSTAAGAHITVGKTADAMSAAGGGVGGFRNASPSTSMLIHGSPLRLEQLQLIVEVLLLVWKTQGELLPANKLINHSSPAFVQSPLLLLLLLLLDHTAAEVKAQLLQSRGQLLFQLLYQVLIGRPDQFLGSALGGLGLRKILGVKLGSGDAMPCPMVPWEVMPIAGEPAGAMGLRDEVDVRQVAGSEERLVLSGAEAVNLLLQKLFFQPVGWEAVTVDGITPGVDMCCSLGK